MRADMRQGDFFIPLIVLLLRRPMSSEATFSYASLSIAWAHSLNLLFFSGIPL